MLQLLGKPGVWLDGQPVVLPTKKLLGLIAYLALEGPTSRSRLADLCWSDNDEASARRNLRRELHRLHESGLRDRLETQRETVSLTEPLETDVSQFLAAMKDGDLESGLKRWASGELLEGLELDGATGFHEWLELEREQLARTRRRAMLELAERLETRGEWRPALELHLELLRQDRLQERTHREVMRLHYLLGEREAALTQFEHCKTTLEQELGLAPLPETTLLAGRIRAAQPLDSSTIAPATRVQPLTVPFVGRAGMLHRLRASTAPFTLLVGEPGVGKTRLLNETAPNGLWVCFRHVSSQIPLYAFAESIRNALDQPDARARFDTLAPIWKRETARLIPELEPANTTTTTAGGAEDRARFLEGLACTLEALAGEQHLIVLDDLHWADTQSLELISHLLHRARREPNPVRFLAAVRQDELEHQTQQMLNMLSREGLFETMTLMPFEELEVMALVQDMSGERTPLFSRRLHQMTAGNAYYVMETLRYLFETGNLKAEPGGGWSTPHDETTTDYAELPIPPSVRQAVLERVDRLGPAARRLLEAASLSEDGFRLEEIQPATALSDWEGLEGLDQAVTARVLERSGKGYRFGHELTRSALDTSLGPERRRLIHLKLAQNLERLEGSPARIALHFEQAGKPAAAQPWWVRAAEAAVRVYAHHEALRCYAAALEHATDQQAFPIRMARADLLANLGDHDGWEHELHAADGIVQRGKTPEFMARAALSWVGLLMRRSRYPEALERAESVLAQANLPLSLQRRALYRSAEVLRGLGRLDEAEDRLSRALQLPDAHDFLLTGQIHTEQFILAEMRGDPARAQHNLEQARQAYQAAGWVMGELSSLGNLGALLKAQGLFDQAITVSEEALEKARAVGAHRIEAILLLNLGGFYNGSGRFDQALMYLQQAQARVASLNEPMFENLLINNLAAVHYRRGQYGAALDQFTKALGFARQHGNLEYLLVRQADVAMVHISLGDASTARLLLEEAKTLVQTSGALAAQAAVMTNLARLELLEHQPEQALAWLDRAAPRSNEDHVYRGWVLGQTRLALGDYHGALAATQNLDADPNETARLLAVQLVAQTQLGLPLEPTLRQAVDQLADRRVEPLETLALRRTIAQAYQILGKVQQARKYRQEAAKQLLDMAATLEGYPEVKERFLEMNRDLT
jgi:DNA-binding SARP family transcriptional activator/Tfp pilus assembly protein PilF